MKESQKYSKISTELLRKAEKIKVISDKLSTLEYRISNYDDFLKNPDILEGIDLSCEIVYRKEDDSWDAFNTIDFSIDSKRRDDTEEKEHHPYSADFRDWFRPLFVEWVQHCRDFTIDEMQVIKKELPQ